MHLSVGCGIGLIWREDPKSCRTLAHCTHERAWQPRSDQQHNCRSRMFGWGFGCTLWLPLNRHSWVCSGVRRGDSTGCCCGTGPLSKNTSLTSSLGSWGGCFKRCKAGRKSSRCFFHAWKKTGKLFGEWWVMAKAAKENGMCEGKTEPREEYQSQGPQLLFGQSAGWLSLTVLSCFKQVFFCWCFYSWSSSQTLQQQNWSVKAPNQWLWPAKGTGRVLPAVPVSSASPKLHPQSAAY